MSTSQDLDAVAEQFRERGYATVADFLSRDEVEQLLDEMTSIAESANDEQETSVFATGEKQTGDDYFINSGDKIRFFYEKDAFGPDGQLLRSKSCSLNKVGHALHWLNGAFRRVTFGARMQELVQRVTDFQVPVVPQSMFIYKNPGIGGEVVPHQDASFLYTTPRIQLLGVWIALEDATLENGCLWFLPGSHRDSDGQPTRRFVRNPSGQPALVFTNPVTEYEHDDFVAAPVTKGTLVLIHGLVVHKSEPNRSTRPRPAYTFHVIESKDTTWAPDNWLQPSAQLPFPVLYDNDRAI